MSKLAFSDEILAAYADGELDAETARAVSKAAQIDPRLAQRIALFKGTAELARGAFAPEAPPVPDALLASVQAAIERARAAQPTDAQTSRVERRPDARQTPTLQIAQPPRPQRAANQPHWAVAASVAAVAVGVLAFIAGRQSLPDAQIAAAAPAGIVLTADASQLQQWQNTLSQVPSGQERTIARARGDAVRMGMLASFRDSGGSLCREFSWTVPRQPSVAGVACQDGAAGKAAWTLAFAATAWHVDGGYTPASAGTALDAYVKSIGGGAILDQAQERDALGLDAAPQK